VTYGTQSGQLNGSTANFDGSGIGQTTPVGQYPPNSLGLHDMAGNVWEWVQDAYDEKAYRSGSADNPVNNRSGAYRVFRGGGWYNTPLYVRCSFRSRDAPSVRSFNLGFRLARDR
jgi:formylglycine-generating enzyme required for sulfatase activity